KFLNMSTLTTPTTTYPWRPDSTYFAANEVVGDALILQTSTVAESILSGSAPATYPTATPNAGTSTGSTSSKLFIALPFIVGKT
ncbi:MAG: hypothetical protein AB7G47_04625, partial [Mycolicibacterium sp.]